MKTLEKAARAYRDLSSAGDAAVAANALFDTLRWAEGVPGAANVFIADLSEERASSALIAGVADRVYRAASGPISRSRSRSPLTYVVKSVSSYATFSAVDAWRCCARAAWAALHPRAFAMA